MGAKADREEMSMTDIQIKTLAEQCLSQSFSDVKIVESDSVFVEVTPGQRVVGGANIPQKLRALSLLSLHEKEKTVFLREKPRFERLGAMLDMSRGGVMRVSAVKEYINRLALYGANELLLYTEDTYSLEEYPHFGYLRGAYTDEELREIDAYAASLDMEVVPCIQTLGHMEQFLSWGGETAEIRDTSNVLLVDSEATYRFIEAEIAKMRKVFRSRRIHIGMDEACDVGLGNYLRKNGFHNRGELMKRHLKRVLNICGKYGFQAMMWSDMFFRLESATDEYYQYDWEYHFSKEAVENIPDVEMVYWDYYNDFEGAYQNMVRLHRELQKPMAFAGGIWAWNGFLPDHNRTEKTMMPALKVCREEGIGNVIATMWGDNGCETDYFRGLIDFAFFSEHCYSESEPTREEILRMGEHISGESVKVREEIAKFHSLTESSGKGLLWGDPFYNLTGLDFAETKHEEIYSAAAESPALAQDEYARLIFRIAAMKARIYANLQREYRQGVSLAKYAESFGQLIADYSRLFVVHRDNWRRINKPFGFEKIEARYHATIGRLISEKALIEAYAQGEIPAIEELEYTPIYGENRGYYYQRFAFPGI